jgi:hypothetical protein
VIGDIMPKKVNVKKKNLTIEEEKEKKKREIQA